MCEIPNVVRDPYRRDHAEAKISGGDRDLSLPSRFLEPLWRFGA